MAFWLLPYSVSLLPLVLLLSATVSLANTVVSNTVTRHDGSMEMGPHRRALPSAPPPRARPMPIPLPQAKNQQQQAHQPKEHRAQPVPVATAFPHPRPTPASPPSSSSSSSVATHRPRSRQPPPHTHCSLPSDFWCDHPAIARLCKATAYCEDYRAKRAGKEMELKLAFESGCPDSQKLIMHRFYPKVLSNPALSRIVDFKAVPWGLAKRHYGHQVQCHHGPRECSGNRLISCALRHPHTTNDPLGRHRLFNCFMGQMMAAGDPERGMVNCAAGTSINVNDILKCARSDVANKLQVEDESETERILASNARFVPFVSLNGWSHLELQAPAQLLLAEKLAHWNRTLHKVPSVSKRSTLKRPPSADRRNCDIPPDFWCSSDPSITHSCFNEQKCQAFQRTLYGQPVQLKVLFNSDLFTSREYLHRYLRPHFFSGTSTPRSAENAGKVRVELEPTAMTRRWVAECRRSTEKGCRRRILEICIAFTVPNAEARNAQLMCINNIEWVANSDSSSGSAENVMKSWQANCNPSSAHTERIRNCVANDPIWRLANARLGIGQRNGLWPEQRRTDPWLVLNGLSLASVQQYAYVLDQTVCLWYRGPGHDRSACGRCEYEPTHC